MENKQTRDTRNSWEIDMAIFGAMSNGEMHKTRVMFAAYVDTRNFERHIDRLVAGGFVSVRVDGRYIYLSATAKGKSLERKLSAVSRLYVGSERD